MLGWYVEMPLPRVEDPTHSVLSVSQPKQRIEKIDQEAEHRPSDASDKEA